MTLWDTSAPLSEPGDLRNRANWKPVPSNLLVLEADPLKAGSDPAYYGREYAFNGDAVVENLKYTAVLSASEGRLRVYSRADSRNASGRISASNGQLYEIVPLQAGSDTATPRGVEILRNAGDEVALKVFFASRSSETSAVFDFDKTEIVAVKPSANMRGVTLTSPIEYGVVPDFIGDDLIYSAADFSSRASVPIPAERIFLGLQKGEERALVLTWPDGRQRIKLRSTNERQGARLIQGIDFENDGRSLFLAVLETLGIWHKEPLERTYLEKDIEIAWRRPFPAKWITQLPEARATTTFAFRQSKSQIWRGVPGMYSYPVWFDGEKTMLRLSKKIPPKGDALIYFLEGQGTPAWVTTPVDILKSTLGREASDSILDIPGRKLRSHHRRGAEGVRRACTCGATDAIQAVFEAGKECEEIDYIEEALGDMVYFVERHIERIGEYQQFAAGMIRFLQTASKARPDLSEYLDALERIVRRIPEECEVQKENMKSLEHADLLTRQTMALTKKKDSANLKAYLDLLKAWRAMGGAQDYVLAQCHTITRTLFQQAGYQCVKQPDAVELAMAIRRRCLNCLRNPDGYEIWPNY